MKVNRSKWATLKMQWEAKLRSIAAFKGIKDYEEWAMGMTPPQPLGNPLEGFMDSLEEGEFEFREWTPEEFHKAHTPVPTTEKEKLFAQAKEIREQINKAITDEDYEKADILQRTLDVIKLKYDKL